MQNKVHVHDCQFCYQRTRIIFEDQEEPVEIFCPGCGVPFDPYWNKDEFDEYDE